MKLLSEEEEDVYLDEGMQAEEDVFSVDYDVWIDEETGDTKIEKYEGSLVGYECDECGFQTLRLEKEILGEEKNNREIKQLFTCSYCGRKIEKIVGASQGGENAALSKAMKRKNIQSDIQLVKVQILNSKGEATPYEFQTLKQAADFLNAYQGQKDILQGN